MISIFEVLLSAALQNMNQQSIPKIFCVAICNHLLFQFHPSVLPSATIFYSNSIHCHLRLHSKTAYSKFICCFLQLYNSTIPSVIQQFHLQLRTIIVICNSNSLAIYHLQQPRLHLQFGKLLLQPTTVVPSRGQSGHHHSHQHHTHYTTTCTHHIFKY